MRFDNLIKYDSMQARWQSIEFADCFDPKTGPLSHGDGRRVSGVLVMRGVFRIRSKEGSENLSLK